MGDKTVVPFSELEENINDADLMSVKDEALEEELFLSDR